MNTTLCEQDGKCIKNASVNHHNKSVHVVEKKFECGICTMKFKTKRDLSGHISKGTHGSYQHDCDMTKNPSKECLEFGAKQCEKFGKLFSVLFPDENITRKQHVFCVVLPKFLRKGTCYRMMKIEQMAEFLHCIYNSLESDRKNQKNRAKRFFGAFKHTRTK